MKRIFIILLTGLFLLSQTISVYGTAYEYDDLDRVTRVTYEDGTSVSYTYDANGNVTAIAHTDKGGETNPDQQEEPDQPGNPDQPEEANKEDSRDAAILGANIGEEAQDNVPGAADLQDNINETGEQEALQNADKSDGGSGGLSETETHGGKEADFILAAIVFGAVGIITLQKIKSKKQTKEKMGYEMQGEKNEGDDME